MRRSERAMRVLRPPGATCAARSLCTRGGVTPLAGVGLLPPGAPLPGSPDTRSSTIELYPLLLRGAERQGAGA